MTPTVSDRHHAFDALRASMMLLGIVLHGAINYMSTPVIDVWPYQDSATTPLADLLVVGIHIFRMPVFFVMAGFFTGLLVERRGIGGTLRNRFMRVVLPFAIFWVILDPLTIAASTFAVGAKAGDGFGALRAWMGTGPFWLNNTIHLWFLWYLTIFYVGAAVVQPIARRLSPALVATVSRGFVGVMSSPARALVFALPSVVIVYFQGGSLITAVSFPIRWCWSATSFSSCLGGAFGNISHCLMG